MTATSQLRKLPITALAAALLVISTTKCATAGDNKPLSPIAEGWINSGANAGGRWSIARPEMLGARNRGTEAAWATYLAFELPSLPTSPGKPALQLTLVKPLKSPQNLALYGVEGKTWSIRARTRVAFAAPFPAAASVAGSTMHDPWSLAESFRVPRDSFFVMGDNRTDSDDSRVWGIVPRAAIIGEGFATYWPFSRLRAL